MFRRDDRPGAVTRAAGQVPDSTGVDPVRFREVVGRFPTGVTVVSAHAGGRHHGMTANSFTSVSLDPVLVLVCVERDARLHDLVLAAGEWGVSVLAADQEGVSRLFAERGRSSADALRSVRHRYGELTGAVLLDGALATFECRTVAVHGGGDHIVLLGEVLGMGLPRPEAGPLVYYRGGYRGLD
jgi:flavin reductase (DIM6/NTAB) family NADH-FMN oxidoreductase RutF